MKLEHQDHGGLKRVHRQSPLTTSGHKGLVERHPDDYGHLNLRVEMISQAFEQARFGSPVVGSRLQTKVEARRWIMGDQFEWWCRGLPIDPDLARRALHKSVSKEEWDDDDAAYTVQHDADRIRAVRRGQLEAIAARRRERTRERETREAALAQCRDLWSVLRGRILDSAKPPTIAQDATD